MQRIDNLTLTYIPLTMHATLNMHIFNIIMIIIIIYVYIYYTMESNGINEYALIYCRS